MNLESLRIKIDEIDEAMLTLLGRRFETTRKIGRLKSASGISSRSKDRETQQFQRFVDLAENFDVPVLLVERMYRDIIDQVVSEHKDEASRNTGAA